MADKAYIRRYMVELGTIVDTLHTYDEQLTKLKATMAMASGPEILQEQLKDMHRNQANLVKVYDTALAVGQDFANCDTLEKISDLYNDIQINMNQASEAYQQWRKAKASFELVVSLEGFESDEDRASYEKELSYLKDRSEASLELVSNLIPQVARLIHV